MTDDPAPKQDVRDTSSAGQYHFFSLAEPSDARQGIFNSLFFNLKDGWQFPFWLMLILSAGLGSLGLSENSAATIIGAMIIAPLGQPIIALGASVALGWPRQFLRLLGLIIIGAICVVAVGFGIGRLLPTATPNTEVLARTAPDFRDLGIAIFAGTAGAYGYYRAEFSTVLAGVAIAVALVPPLCTAGLMFDEGRYVLASGGLMLFATNLIGITAAAIFAFFAFGVAQADQRRGWFIGGTIATLVAILLILVPLAANYKRLASGSLQLRRAYQAADEALKAVPGDPVVAGVSIDGALVTIRVIGLTNDPVMLQHLTDAIQKQLSLQVDLVPAAE